MPEFLLSEINELESKISTLAATLTGSQRNMPEQFRTTDRTNTVSITLGKEGIPQHLSVHPHWTNRLRATEFDAAVWETSQLAHAQLLEHWATEFSATASKKAADIDDLSAGSLMDRPRGQVRSRSVNDLADGVIGEFESFDGTSLMPQRVSATHEKLTLTLCATGQVTCATDPEWLSRQSSTVLTRTLNDTLTACRQQLVRLDNKQQCKDLDVFVAEALAHFSSAAVAGQPGTVR